MNEQNDKISRLLKVLRLNIDELNHSYKVTLSELPTYFDYDKKYPYNKETLKKFKEGEILLQLEIDKLYAKIFNFTQAYYCIKESLVKTFTKIKYPDLNKVLNNYFCIEKINGISRTDICNKLKHIPNKDLDYKLNLKKVQFKTKNGLVSITNNHGKTWFFEDIDSIKFCNFLYDDLMKYLENIIPDIKIP